LASGCGSIDNSGIEIKPSHTVQPTSTYTPSPAKTSAPSPTQTSIPSTSTLGIGSTMISDSDGMTLLYIPAGEFTMGSEDFGDTQPIHVVYLDSFWIDQTEVTNKQYALCISDNTCTLPSNLKSPMRSSYYGDPQFENYPVIYVEWAMAKTYCEWAGRRPPSEAEWEKAARGEEAYIYPWGHDAPNDNLLNYNSAERDTTEVGTYPDGKSPYGALDMAGNVWEWVHDWYDGAYYQNSSSSNPLGPDVGEPSTGFARVLRGGSWFYEEGSLRSIFRFGVIPVDDLVRSDLRSWLVPVYADTSIYGKPPHGLGTVGFRCAMSATP
jgi:formylglycine-generating enzyme required for sulfatase activity